MAQQDTRNQATDATPADTPIPPITPPPTHENQVHHPDHYHGYRKPSWAAGIIVGIAAFIILAFIATAITFSMHTYRSGYGPSYGPPHGMYPMRDYNQSSTPGQVRISGVVTAVNGTTLTIAGNGKSTQVTSSDATTYVGADQPAAVNDSITVIGTMNSEGNLTAITIRLMRQ